MCYRCDLQNRENVRALREILIRVTSVLGCLRHVINKSDVVEAADELRSMSTVLDLIERDVEVEVDQWAELILRLRSDANAPLHV